MGLYDDILGIPTSPQGEETPENFAAIKPIAPQFTVPPQKGGLYNDILAETGKKTETDSFLKPPPKANWLVALRGEAQKTGGAIKATPDTVAHDIVLVTEKISPLYTEAAPVLRKIAKGYRERSLAGPSDFAFILDKIANLFEAQGKLPQNYSKEVAKIERFGSKVFDKDLREDEDEDSFLGMSPALLMQGSLAVAIAGFRKIADTFDLSPEERVAWAENPPRMQMAEDFGYTADVEGEAGELLQQEALEGSLLNPLTYLKGLSSQLSNILVGMGGGALGPTGWYWAFANMKQLEEQELALAFADVKDAEGNKLIPPEVVLDMINLHGPAAGLLEYAEISLLRRPLSPAGQKQKLMRSFGASPANKIFKGLFGFGVSAGTQVVQEDLQTRSKHYFYDMGLDIAEAITEQNFTPFRVTEAQKKAELAAARKMAFAAAGGASAIGVGVQQTQKRAALIEHYKQQGLTLASAKKMGLKYNNTISTLGKAQNKSQQDVYNKLNAKTEAELEAQARDIDTKPELKQEQEQQAAESNELNDFLAESKDRKAALIEYLTAFDTNVRTELIAGTLEEIQNSKLDTWHKFILSLSEMGQMSVADGLDFRAVVEGIYETEMGKPGTTQVDFSMWFDKQITLTKPDEKQGELFQEEVSTQAVYSFEQETMEPEVTIPYYELLVEIPGHPIGSSVSAETLTEAGIAIPPKTAPSLAQEEFFSPLSRAIEGMKQEIFGTDQLKGVLKKAPGVKQEELNDLGFYDWLDGLEGKVTKAQALAFIEQGGPQIKEVVKGRKDDTQTQADIDILALGGTLAGSLIQEGDTKFGSHTLPGGKNYKEILLTLPVPDDTSQVYQSPHFDEPNVFAHIRMNDRVGPKGEKILFIEEIQSDLHQEGRKKGYKEEKLAIEKDLKEKYPSLPEDSKWWTRNLLADNGVNMFDSNRWLETTDAVLNVPFKKSWAMLSMKTVLRMAAEQGYDSVAWTPGKVQNDRYDLSKQVDRIEYSFGAELLIAIKDDETIITEGGVSEKDLEGYVGKEAAKKLLAQEGSPRVLEGDDLKVGGEGMVSFYDKILPKAVQKYVKKMGGKVETTQLDLMQLTKAEVTELKALMVINESEDGLTRAVDIARFEELALKAPLSAETDIEVWNLSLTPAMRTAILAGQSLYQLGKQVTPTSRIAKGMTAFVQMKDEFKAFVQFFSTGDFSTLVHELAHVNILNLTDAQLATLAKQVVKGTSLQWAPLIGELKVFRTNPLDKSLLDERGKYKSSVIRVQEYFAEQFELYIATGKAPTRELKAPFKAYRKRMLKIYKKLSAIPHMTMKMDAEMAVLFDEMIGGVSLTQTGEHMAVKMQGIAYTAFVSKPQLAAHNTLLKKIEEGLADLAGIHDAVKEYAINMLGETIRHKNAKGVWVEKPNPALKDGELNRRIDKIKTREDAWAIMNHIDRTYLRQQKAAQKDLIDKIKEMLAKVDLKKLDPTYKIKLEQELKDVDFKKMTPKKLKSLQGLHAAIVKEMAGAGDGSILGLSAAKLKDLTRLQDKNIYDFTIDELTTMYDGIVTLLHLVNLKSDLQVTQAVRFLKKQYDQASDEAEHLPEKDIYKEGARGAKLRVRQLSRLVKQVTITGVRLPENLLEYLSDFNHDSAIYGMFHNISEGAAYGRGFNKQTYDFLQGLAAQYDMAKWSPHTRQVGNKGSFPNLETVVIRRKVVTEEKITYAEVVVPVNKEELKAYSKGKGTPDIYSIVIKGRNVAINQDDYNALLQPERLDTDFVFLRLHREGRTILQPVSKAQRLTLYMYSLNEDAKRHLIHKKGGLMFRNNPTYIYHMTEAELTALDQVLSTDEKATALAILNHYETVVKPAINAVSMELDFRNIATEINYFPILAASLSGDITEILNLDSTSTTHAAFYRQLIERQSFLQSRTGSSSPMWIEDAFEIMSGNLDGVGKYLGLAQPIRVAKLIIKGGAQDSSSFRNRVSRSWGPETLVALERWIENLEDPRYAKHEDFPKLLRYLSGAQTVALLGWNVTVALIQRPSVNLCRNYGISFASLQKAKLQNITAHHKIADLMELHPDFFERYLKGFNMALSETHTQSRARMNFALHKSIFKDAMNVRDFKDVGSIVNRGLREEGMMWIYKNDAWALSVIWDATQDQVKKDNPAMTAEQQHTTALDLMRQIVRKTQPDYLLENLSSVHSSKSIATRLMIAKFNNQRHKLFNETERGMRLIDRGLKPSSNLSTKARLRSMIEGTMSIWRAIFMINFYVSLIRQLLFEVGADEEEKKRAGPLVTRTLLGTIQNMVSIFPIFGPLASMSIAEARGMHAFEWSNIVQSGLSGAGIEAGKTLEAMTEGELESTFEHVYKTTEKLLGALAGYPLYQIRKDIRYLITISKKIEGVLQ